MEFQVEKAGFVEALSLTQGVVERRNTLPILANVLIESVDGGLKILATDLDVGIRKFCAGTVSRPGAITVNARKLFEIARAAPGEKISVKSADAGRVEVSSGRYHSKLLGLDPKEFPAIPSLTSKPGKGAATMRTSGDVLRGMIERTVFAVSLDETRVNLSGVFCEAVDGRLRMVATDGHRLAMVDRKIEGDLPKKGVILPRKGLAEARKALESQDGAGAIAFSVDGSVARIETGQTEVFMTLVEGEFPDYRQVIPKQGTITLALDRDELLDALSRVSLLSNERSRGVRLSLRSGALELRTTNPDLGEASEELEIEYRGDEVVIGFNARYLSEVLGVLAAKEKVELSVTDDVSPGVVRVESDEQFSYVVMPMRL